MNIANQFEKIDILFADNRFITVLEQMPASTMATIKIYRGAKGCRVDTVGLDAEMVRVSVAWGFTTRQPTGNVKR
jgi:hypothetical protein